VSPQRSRWAVYLRPDWQEQVIMLCLAGNVALGAGTVEFLLGGSTPVALLLGVATALLFADRWDRLAPDPSKGGAPT
jgi:hypothetical protein